MGAIGWILLLLLLLIPLTAILYILFARHQAQRDGRPPPSFASFNPFAKRSGTSQSHSTSPGFIGKIRSRFQPSKKATRSGAYEQPLGSRNRRGLDPDEAWDARVGTEGDGYGAGEYFEEQELGLHPPSGGGAYSGGGYGANGYGQDLPDYGAEEMTRGRSRSRDFDRQVEGGQGGLDQRYDEEMREENPFGDHAERSHLRGISPRPIEDERPGHSKKGSQDSVTERRGVFRGDV